MIQWIVFPWENPSEGFSRPHDFKLPPSSDRLCPHAGRAPTFCRTESRQRFAQENQGSLGELSFRGDCDSPRAPTFDGRSPP